MEISRHLQRFIESGKKVYIPEEDYSIDLSLTENPLGFSERVFQVFEKKGNIQETADYPDPSASELKEALHRKFSLPPENILVGNGANELIEVVIRALIDEGDKMIVPEVTFSIFDFVNILTGGETVISQMDDFEIDFEDIKRKADGETKLIFLCNPNNPTGKIESKDDILDLVESVDCPVAVDEANIEFGGESLYSEVPKHDNLIILRSFSKAYGLAGMRIGYCFGPESFVHAMWRSKPPFTTTVLAQKCAVEALKDDEHIEKSKEFVEKERKFLMEELKNRGFEIVPSQANCFIVKVDDMFQSSTKFVERLHKKDANCVDGKWYEGLGTSYVRLTPRKRETNQKFLKIIDEIK